MTRSLMSTLMALVLTAAVVATAGAQARPDFAGTWVPNGGKPGPTLVIAIAGDKFSVERHTMVRDSERVQTSNYALDDTPSTNDGAGGAKITSKSHREGATIVTTWTTEFDSDEGKIPIENKEIWSVSSDGRGLTVEATQKSPRQSATQKQVFVRKS